MIKKVKNTAPWAYVISDLNGGEVLRKKIAKNKLKRA